MKAQLVARRSRALPRHPGRRSISPGNPPRLLPEAQALAEVRSRSADIAVEAARVLLTQQMAERGDALVDQAIKDVGNRLN